MKHLPKNVMIDLETLGQETGCAILSVGACRFDFEKKEIFDEFYLTIDFKTSFDVGLTYSKDTLDWWRKQNPEALKQATRNGKDVTEAMKEVESYFKKGFGEYVWAWGSHFDIPILERAMRLTGINKVPWHYGKVCDARTVKNIFNQDIDRTQGTHHNALDDAKAQAKYLMNLFGE